MSVANAAVEHALEPLDWLRRRALRATMPASSYFAPRREARVTLLGVGSIGVSLLGTILTLFTGLQRSADERLRGLVCVNPAAAHEAPEMREMLADFLDDGTTVIPGIGSDIADPDVAEIAYDGTPVAPLISLIDAKADIADRYGELSIPLLLFTSHDDHVVPPDQSRHLAAT